MKVLLLSVSLLCSAGLAATTQVVCNPDDTLLPNPDDCSSFYTCDNGVPRLTLCPPTLHFNPEANVCDRVENANCENSGNTTTEPPLPSENPTTVTTSKPTSSTSKPSPTTSTSTPIPTTTAPPPTSTTTEEPSTSQPSAGCPAEGSAIIANPDSCNSFLVCINGNSVSVDCPLDMQFNPETGACDLNENVLCGNEITTREPATTEETTTADEITTTEDMTTDESTTEETTTPDEITTTEDMTTDESTTEEDTTTSKPITTSTTSKPNTTTTSTTKRPTTTTTRKPATTTTRRPTTTTSTTSKPTTVTSSTPTTAATTETTDSTSNTADTPTTSEEVPTEIATTTEPPNDTTTESNEDTTTESDDEPTDDQTTTEENEATTTEENKTEPDCPESGYAIIPNPSDCSSFFVCVNGLSAEIDCPAGLDFNITTAKCEDPVSAQCRGEPTTDIPATTPDPYVPPCPAQGITQLSNPRDCSSFYVCIDGLFAKLSCPENLEFNEAKQSCVNAAQANCTVTNFDFFSEDLQFQCVNDGSYPNPDDCGSYFVCVGGNAIKMDCPAGLHFDSDLLGCNIPELAHCDLDPSTSSTSSSSTSTPTTSTSTTTTTTVKPTSTTSSTSSSSTSTPTTSTSTTTTTTVKPTSTTNTPSTPKPTTPPPSTSTTTTTRPTSSSLRPGTEPDCPINGTAILPNPDDCTSFFVCIEGDYGVVECPPGYGFNPELENCEPDAQCGDEGNSTLPPTSNDCPSSGTAKLPNPADCGSYFFCINGQSTIINCPSGLNFNAETSTCDAQAKCDAPSSTSSSSTSTSSTSTSTPTSPTGSTPTTSKPTSPPSVSCEKTGDILPNPSSCESFFICDNGVPVEVHCPPGLEFNAELSVCDDPSSANCKVTSPIINFLRFWY